MRSIGSRITLWYVATLVATLASLFVVGDFLLERYLLRQLDELNEAQFNHLRATLGRDYGSLKPAEIDDRIRQATESASALFYVDMHGPMTNRFFKSRNLQGIAIPDLPGQKNYSIVVAGIGEVRVGEFQLTPYDVMVATPLTPVHDLLSGYRWVFLWLLAGAVVISALVGWGLSKLILRPIRIIQAIANRIRSDNLSQRIPVDDVKDEISQLALFLNQMFDRLEASFSEIRRFAAEASHELKTPLSLIRLQAENLLVKSDLSPAQRAQLLSEQLDEVARVNRIIDDLLFLSRADAGAILVEPARKRPAEVLASFAQDAAALAESEEKKFIWTHAGEGDVDIDWGRIRQVLLNLVTNALTVTSRGGVVALDSTLAGDLWRVSVLDEGPGLSPQDCERIFERFVRLPLIDQDPRGSGLGLAISRSIVSMHKGRLWASSRDVGRGLRVSFEIPAHSFSA